MLFPSPDRIISEQGLPDNPSKIHSIFNTVFIDLSSQNDFQIGPKIIIKPSFYPDRNPTLFFSHFGIPNGAPKPRKLQYYLSKTSISTNPPFAFCFSFWHPKVSQNMSNIPRKPFNKTSRKLIQNRHQIS